MNLGTKNKQTHRQREQICGCQEGGGVEEGQTGSLGLADANYLHRMDKQQGLTVQHRELYHNKVINHNRKEYEKECKYN